MAAGIFRILVLALITAPALAQKAQITFQATEVAPGILMLQGVGGFSGGNLGMLDGPDGAVLIDNGVAPLAEKTAAAVRGQVGDVEYVVNTHAHGDHIGGNAAMTKSGATIIAHHKLRQRLIDEGISGPDGQIKADKHWLPEITFAKKLSLHLNGHHVKVIHVAHAHTDGDSFVYFPDANVIHTGDVLFNGLFPYIDLDSGGSVDGYLAAQKKLLALADDKTQIIPGHGPLAKKNDLQAAHDMLMDACEKVSALIDAGKTDKQILAMNPLADYDADWNWGFITTEKMTNTLIKDLRGK